MIISFEMLEQLKHTILEYSKMTNPKNKKDWLQVLKDDGTNWSHSYR